MNLDVDLLGAAEMLHYRYDWMQKNWRRLMAEEEFPPPFRGNRPRGRPWWRAAAIEAWKDQRSGLPSPLRGARQDVGDGPRPANDPVHRPMAPKGRVSALLAAAGAPRPHAS